jgi:hypothetical protein
VQYLSNHLGVRLIRIEVIEGAPIDLRADRYCKINSRGTIEYPPWHPRFGSRTDQSIEFSRPLSEPSIALALIDLSKHLWHNKDKYWPRLVDLAPRLIWQRLTFKRNHAVHEQNG